MKSSSPAFVPSSRRAAWAEALKLVDRCAQLGVPWNADFGPHSDLTLALLFKRCWISYSYVPELGVDEIVWPPAYGQHQMMISAELGAGPRRFAMRHGLAHVLAGHNCIAVMNRDWHGAEETAADLFALLDIIPDVQLEELRAGGRGESEIARWCYAEIARWTAGWAAERIADRVELRLDAMS